MKRHSKICSIEAGSKLLGDITDHHRNPLSLVGDNLYSSADSVQIHVPYLDSIADVVTEKELPDLIGTGGFEIILSEKFRAILDTFNIDHRIRFARARVISRRKLVVSESYWFPYSEKWHNVLDLKESNAVVYSNGMIQEIDQWKVDPARVPRFDLWFAHAERWFISNDLAVAVKRAKLSNVIVSCENLI